jgi:hypothetical protein
VLGLFANHYSRTRIRILVIRALSFDSMSYSDLRVRPEAIHFRDLSEATFLKLSARLWRKLQSGRPISKM